MQSFDTTIQLAAIRRDELLHAAARGRTARILRRRRHAGNHTARTEGASR
jgi:hypothetical protein